MEVLEILLNDQRYHLTGSRQMAKLYPNDVIVNENTDYDFSVQNSQEIENHLFSLGFEKRDFKNEKYKCNQTIYLFEKENIDVVLRKDLYIYLKAFSKIPCYDYLTKLWKSSSYFSGCSRSIQYYMNNAYKRAQD